MSSAVASAAQPVQPVLRPAYFQMSSDNKEPLKKRVGLWLHRRMTHYLRKDGVQPVHYPGNHPGMLNDTLKAFQDNIVKHAAAPSAIIICISTHGNQKRRGQFRDQEQGEEFFWTPQLLWQGRHKLIQQLDFTKNPPAPTNEVKKMTTFVGLHAWLRDLRAATNSIPPTSLPVYVVFAQCYGGLFAADLHAIAAQSDLASELGTSLHIVGLSEGKTCRPQIDVADTKVSNMQWHRELTKWIKQTFPLTAEEKTALREKKRAINKAIAEADGKDVDDSPWTDPEEEDEEEDAQAHGDCVDSE